MKLASEYLETCGRKESSMSPPLLRNQRITF